MSPSGGGTCGYSTRYLNNGHHLDMKQSRLGFAGEEAGNIGIRVEGPITESIDIAGGTFFKAT